MIEMTDILIANNISVFYFTPLDIPNQFLKSNYLCWLYCIDTYNHKVFITYIFIVQNYLIFKYLIPK